MRHQHHIGACRGITRQPCFSIDPIGPGNFIGATRTWSWRCRRQQRSNLSAPRRPCALSECAEALRRLMPLPTGGDDFSPTTPMICALPESIFWRPEHDASVLALRAQPANRRDRDTLDLAALPCPLTVLKEADDHEYVIIGTRPFRIRLAVTGASVLAGPVRFQYELAGLRSVETTARTLLRLLALARLHRMPRALFHSERRAARWAMQLRVLDALAMGASQRDIAISIFGERRVREEWLGRSDSMRLYVQRLVRSARLMAHNKYGMLLR